MKTTTLATFTGGLSALTAISYFTLGTTAAFILGAILIFIAGIFLGALGVIYPIARKPGTCLYFTDGKVRHGSMLKPLTGLRDMAGNLIEPGNLVMMLGNGDLLMIDRNAGKLRRKPDNEPVNKSDA